MMEKNLFLPSYTSSAYRPRWLRWCHDQVRTTGWMRLLSIKGQMILEMEQHSSVESRLKRILEVVCQPWRAHRFLVCRNIAMPGDPDKCDRYMYNCIVLLSLLKYHNNIFSKSITLTIFGMPQGVYKNNSLVTLRLRLLHTYTHNWPL